MFNSQLDFQTEELAIPQQWVTTYAHIFAQDGPKNTVVVNPVQPIVLTQVVLTALSDEAYQAAQGPNSILENWISVHHPIFRQREICTITSRSLPLNGSGSSESGRSYQFRLNMLEPVQQGCPQIGYTRFILLLSDVGNDLDAYHERESEIEDDSDSDRDGIEIDEDFLANSVLSSIHEPPSSAVQTSASLVDGKPHESQNSLRPEPLPKPCSVQDDYTLYLRTTDLGKIGLLNGDWVSPSATTVFMHISFLCFRLLFIRIACPVTD